MRISKLQVVIFLLLAEAAVGQNARFSQLGTSTQMFNPSLTGRFDGKARFGALYSIQESDFATTHHQNAFLEYKFGKYRSSGDEDYRYVAKTDGKKVTAEAKDKITEPSSNRPAGYWAAGLNYYRYGHSDMPITGEFYSASIARHFYPKRNKYWGLGAQVTYAKGKLDETDGMKYDREISGNGFTYPYGTPGGRIGDNSYVDFNVGGYYGMVTEPVAFEIGGAMYHLFYPKNDIVGQDDEKKLRHRVTAHSMLRLRLNNKWGIVQKNYYWQEGMYLRSRRFNADSMHIDDFWAGLEFYKTQPEKNINFSFGLYTRSFRTVMPYANLYLGKVVNLRASYEQPLNFGKYNAYTAQRLELALILSYKKNTNPGTEFYRKVNFW
ncbi:MAG TPA: hypothetical protein PLE75_10135 [Ferruginibacter sp.]|nr:hypothetical protein [Ferruginibacter sp.]HRO07033.1 hypothetical protein [Ferruginibacter sp.]HRO97304.1 hypothetical protein [Ferruginibacter sp.]HRP50473.1 hypothetical protein [Ferruginibacter sp.]